MIVSSSPLNTLITALWPVQQRLRIQAMFRRVVINARNTAILMALIGALRMGLGLTINAWLTGLILVLGPSLAAVFAWFRVQPPTRAAELVDQHYGLKDRTLTALAFAAEQCPSEFQQLQIADAIKRLHELDPRVVVPIEWPRQLRFAAAVTVAAIVLSAWPVTPQPVVAQAEYYPEVVAVADAIEDELKELNGLAEQLVDKQPEMKTLADELAEQLKVLKIPGTEPRKALETISEMQSKLAEQLKELDPTAIDTQMKNLSEALSSAEPFRPTSAELQKGDYQKAADELDRLKSPDLDRQEARSTKQKLDEAAKSMDEAGLKELGDAVKQLADAIKDNEVTKLDEATKELANETREQGVRRQVGQKLAKKLGRLGELKSLAQNGDQEGNRNSMQKGKNQKSERSSQTFGQGDHGKLDGAKSELSTTRQIQQLQGTLGDGDSEKEMIQGDQTEETAKRRVQATFGKYQKLSETVLESEPIPLGQRQMIRKYFELIRPETASEQ